MSRNRWAERLVTITDVDADGTRHPVLATSDPEIIGAVEMAVQERLRRPQDDPLIPPATIGKGPFRA